IDAGSGIRRGPGFAHRVLLLRYSLRALHGVLSTVPGRGCGVVGHVPLFGGAVHVLEYMLTDQRVIRQRDGIVAIETGRAQPRPGLIRSRDQPVQRHVTQRVGADRPSHTVEIQAVGDKFGTAGEVDAVEARPPHRWGRDTDVDLQRSRLPQHAHQRTLGVAANDRIVDHDEALAADHVPQRIEFESNAELAYRLGGLDERTADIPVLDQAGTVVDTRLGRITDRGRRARLRDRDHQVGLGGMLLGEVASDGLPGGVHATPGDRGVRAGAVDALAATPLRLRPGATRGTQPLGVDREQLTGLHLPYEGRSHNA